MRRSSGTLALGALVLSVIVVGCSGGGSKATGGPAGSPAATSPAAPSGGGGAGGGALGAPVAAGGDLCGLLGPGDFAAVGVPGANKPTENNAPPTDYYCVYAGKSSATGGIEFDAFIAGSPADAKSVYTTVVSGGGLVATADRAADVGADQATLATTITGDAGPVAIIAVQKGPLVFDIGFPAGPNAESQLVSLARLVLERAAALTK